jgi:hypothetical protein
MVFAIISGLFLCFLQKQSEQSLKKALEVRIIITSRGHDTAFVGTFFLFCILKCVPNFFKQCYTVR